MTRHILEAYAEDIKIRRQDKKTLGRPNEVDGYKVNAPQAKALSISAMAAMC
jgi:hypothetical protein